MKVTLVPLEPPGASRVLEGAVELGRRDLGGRATSERHLLVDTSGVFCTICDLGSTNGTVAGGERVRSKEVRIVVDGTEIRCGDARFLLRIEQGDTSVPIDTSTAGLARAALAAETEGAVSFLGPRVVVAHRGLPARSLVLHEGRVYSLGREADLPFDDATVSEPHAEIRRDGTQVFLRDVGSRHGTTLGGVPLVPFAWTPWPLGMAACLGRAIAVVTGLSAASDPLPAWRILRGGETPKGAMERGPAVAYGSPVPDAFASPAGRQIGPSNPGSTPPPRSQPDVSTPPERAAQANPDGHAVGAAHPLRALHGPLYVGGPPDAVPPLDPDAETKDLRATGKPALGRRIAVAGLVALLLVSIAILVRVLLS